MSPRRRPEILTERLLLALPEPSEAPMVVRYFQENADHLAPWEPPRPREFLTEAHWRGRLAANLAEFESDSAVRLMLRARSDPRGSVLGTVSLNQIVRGGFQAATLGYGLGAGHVGRGIMHEALAAAIRYAFGELNLHRLQANHLPENLRSGALLRRLGFGVEGYAKEYLYIGGRWRDHVLTSLTSSTFVESGPRARLC